jgi:hypothetical protein
LEAIAKIDALAANLKVPANPPTVPLPSNCKFWAQKSAKAVSALNVEKQTKHYLNQTKHYLNQNLITIRTFRILNS